MNRPQAQHQHPHPNPQPRQHREPPPPSRDKHFAAALKAMAEAWHSLVKASEKGKAETVKLCAIGVFGVTAFELAMEDVVDGDERKAKGDAAAVRG
ncbi:hypothetical protein B0A55_04278 [Friedmanniomyces simplex]|uniref:Uncharacterized protein n=1 Tax=Friedmanniomyces simplex TaxID=329884 RepID=A0A4U0XC88_9PEZI|nr:hypothetical protein B0A55_04278 [Friedmanniomyces simplex]